MPPVKVSIAGAGIAGLASAALLARAGHAVTVYDQFDAPAPVGSGLMLQPVGMQVLHRLGLADRAMACTSPINQIYGQTPDRTVLNVRYGDLRPQAQGRAIQRAQLFQMLLDAAMQAGASLVPASTVTGAGQTPETAWLMTGQEKIAHADVVLDCLGAYSPLCPRPSRPLRYGALWALLDWPRDGPFAPDRLEQRYRAASSMVGVLPVGTDAEKQHKLTFFWSLRGKDFDTWQAQPLADWKAQVTDLWPETDAILDQIQSQDDLFFARYTHHTVGHPTVGRIAHLGDSFHATSPQLGQGANMALLDAAALADAFAKIANPRAALKAYARRRRWHVRAYQTISWAFTPMYQSDSRSLPWMRDRVLAPLSFVPPMPKILARLVAGELLPTGMDRQ